MSLDISLNSQHPAGGRASPRPPSIASPAALGINSPDDAPTPAPPRSATAYGRSVCPAAVQHVCNEEAHQVDTARQPPPAHGTAGSAAALAAVTPPIHTSPAASADVCSAGSANAAEAALPLQAPPSIITIYSHGEKHEFTINSRTETPLYTLYSVTPRKDSTP